MSHIPFTLKYEIKRLQDKLEDIEKHLVGLPSPPYGTVDFSRYKFEREKDKVTADIKTIENLLDPIDPDFIA